MHFSMLTIPCSRVFLFCPMYFPDSYLIIRCQKKQRITLLRIVIMSPVSNSSTFSASSFAWGVTASSISPSWNSRGEGLSRIVSTAESSFFEDFDWTLIPTREELEELKLVEPRDMLEFSSQGIVGLSSLSLISRQTRSQDFSPTISVHNDHRLVSSFSNQISRFSASFWNILHKQAFHLKRQQSFSFVGLTKLYSDVFVVQSKRALNRAHSWPFLNLESKQELKKLLLPTIELCLLLYLLLHWWTSSYISSKLATKSVWIQLKDKAKRRTFCLK